MQRIQNPILPEYDWSRLKRHNLTEEYIIKAKMNKGSGLKISTQGTWVNKKGMEKIMIKKTSIMAIIRKR